MRRLTLVAALAIAVAGFVGSPPAAHADVGPVDTDDAGRDETTPTDPGPDTRPQADAGNGGPQILAAPVPGPAIEDFLYDELELEGTASEICAGGLGTGARWSFYEITERFGGLAGTMYACRERWDAVNDPDCNGTVVNPATNPDFFSTCWSNHARGRAIDIMVGQSGGTYNSSRGRAIISWLLAKDSYGNQNAIARRLGVQQILFGDRCWNSEGDRGIAGWTDMRECDIGHHDHVHIDFTEAGAAGDTSYWGATPPAAAPRPDTLVLWDQHSAWREVVSWANGVPTNRGGTALPAGYDRAIVGDWNSDGSNAEIMIWDINTGNWFIQTWANGSSVRARMGMWSVGWDAVIPGDWDGDTHLDDMMFYNQDSGYWMIYSWSNFTASLRATGNWGGTAWDRIINGDFDGDGRLDDMMLWDRDRAQLALYSWQGFQRTYRAMVRTSYSYDEIIVGDWNADGEMNETLSWDKSTGVWVLNSWSSWHNTYRRDGFWNNTFDYAAPGDFDSDGRSDDIFLYDNGSGRWSVHTYHRYTWKGSIRAGQWLAGFDVVSVGNFME